MNRNLYLYAAACAIILMCVELAFAQSLDTPQTRMRPIGSGSAVDQYRSPTPATFPGGISDAAYRGQDSQDQPSLIRQVATGRNENSFVRQTVFLQSGIEAPNLPGNYSLPPGVAPGGSSPFAVPSIQPNLQTNPAVDVSGPNLRAVPQINPLPSNPSTFNPPSVGSSVWSPGTGTHGGSDFAPLPQPQLRQHRDSIF